jgi:hypothetical protein
MNNTISDSVGVAASDGSTSAGLYLTTYFAPGTTMNAHNNILMNNTAGLEVGYLPGDTSTAVALHNAFIGNNFGIATTGPAVTATGNWWGSASGPIHTSNPSGAGDAVSDNVSFTPWLCSGTDTSTDPGFQPLLQTSCYTFDGFFQPIDMTAINMAKAGQTIPIKWRLTDANGLPVSDPSSFVGLNIQSGNCNIGESPDAIEEYVSGASGLQYLGDGYWQFNWKTPKNYAGKCRTMSVEFDGDFTSPVVTFLFK